MERRGKEFIINHDQFLKVTLSEHSNDIDQIKLTVLTVNRKEIFDLFIKKDVMIDIMKQTMKKLDISDIHCGQKIE